jgi:hypothetical protein
VSCVLQVEAVGKFFFASAHLTRGKVLHFRFDRASTYQVDGEHVSILKDPACAAIPGDGTFRAVNGLVSSGPSDNWLTPDGKFLYQIYGNASALIGYSVSRDGALTEIARVAIPYNSPQGLAGF